MSEKRQDPPASPDPVDILRGLRDAVAGSRDDLDRMPVFVRPMVRRGFAKRTGRSLDDWLAVANVLLDRARRSPDALTRSRLSASHPDLMPHLERLAQSYRTAPQRAARFMRDRDTLRSIEDNARARERAVRAVIDLVRSLPE